MSNADNVVAEIRTLEDEFKAGRISASELKELLEDIKHSKAIAVAADDLALKAQLFELIDGIVVAAGAI
jgi:hypothetical protein